MTSFLWLGRRAMIFYILIYLIAHFTVDYGRINFGVKVKRLNRYMPREFSSLLTLEEGGKKVEKETLEQYVRFYRVVVELFPERADARSLLGFCEFYMGNPIAAVSQYQKAAELKPHIFWFFYNPAVIYFKGGQYEEALKYFQEALAADPQETTDYIFNSKVIHRVFFDNIPSIADELRRRLIIGYQNAYILMVAIYYQSKDYPQTLQMIQNAINEKIGRQDVFYYYAGLVYIQLNQYKNAQMAFQKSLALNPDFFESAFFLAETSRVLGDQKMHQEASRKADSLEASKTKHIPHLSQISLRLF